MANPQVLTLNVSLRSAGKMFRTPTPGGSVILPAAGTYYVDITSLNHPSSTNLGFQIQPHGSNLTSVSLSTAIYEGMVDTGTTSPQTKQDVSLFPFHSLGAVNDQNILLTQMFGSILKIVSAGKAVVWITSQ